MRFVFTCIYLLGLGISLFAQAPDHFHKELYPLLSPTDPFAFGIASGDPTQTSVVLWTKIVPTEDSNNEVSWLIAKDSSLRDIAQSGSFISSAENAHTVKITVENLEPGKTWFYQFSCERKSSEIGRTRTAPIDVDQLRFAVVSCSDFQTGHFNAYRHIAARNDLDAVLHLGDYIYETSAKKWGPKKQRKRMYREHIPTHVLRSLKDYRTRYGQYRMDPHLREAHRLHPFITVWDDHEFSNNANSASDRERVQAARQAYFEWLPVQDNAAQSIYRQFSFGSLVDLWMLDTRIEGRTAQAEGEDDLSWQAVDRKMLGDQQMNWLTAGMKKSQATWKILGNQVLFSLLHDSRVFSRVPAVKMDRWDGYPAAQRKLFDFWQKNHIENIIVVTGDVHTSWAFELTQSPLDPSTYDPKTGQGVIGAEFITPSISSFNMNDILPRLLAWESERRFKKDKYNPHLRYLDLVRHGYLSLTLNQDDVRADWYFFNPRRSATKVQQRRSFRYAKKSHSLERVKQ